MTSGRHHALLDRVVLIVAAGQFACAPGARREPAQQEPVQPQPAQRQPASRERPLPSAAGALVTDSTQYTVRFVDGMYRARLGFTFTNRSADAVSLNHCHTPPPPTLEKRVGDEWVRAYSPLMLMCLTMPPFRIGPGATYRDVVDFAATPRGRNVGPTLEVESITGTYRLRWQLRTGSDPDAKDAAAVEAISNEFRLVER